MHIELFTLILTAAINVHLFIIIYYYLWSMRDTHIENMRGAVLYLEMQKRGKTDSERVWGREQAQK